MSMPSRLQATKSAMVISWSNGKWCFPNKLGDQQRKIVRERSIRVLSTDRDIAWYNIEVQESLERGFTGHLQQAEQEERIQATNLWVLRMTHYVTRL